MAKTPHLPIVSRTSSGASLSTLHWQLIWATQFSLMIGMQQH
jgi:hypothetical protein